MPWSAWIVAILFVAISIPYFGEYVALLVAFASVMLVYTLLGMMRPLGPVLEKPTDIVAGAMGVNSAYVWPGVLAAIILGAGLYCLVRALRSEQRSAFTHAAILLLGFLAVAATAGYRVGRLWPT